MLVYVWGGGLEREGGRLGNQKRFVGLKTYICICRSFLQKSFIQQNSFGKPIEAIILVFLQSIGSLPAISPAPISVCNYTPLIKCLSEYNEPEESSMKPVFFSFHHFP